MSPSEDDLRAALRRGEGDAPDAGRIVARAAAVQSRRRAQLRSGALGVVLVAAVGAGGGALLARGGGDSGTAGSSGEKAAGSAGNAGSGSSSGASSAAAAGSSARGAASRGAASAALPATCPSSAPHYLLPGGGSPGQFGAGGPLFGAPVTSVLVCAYGAASGARAAPAVRHVVVSGTAARQLVSSLESASRRPVPEACPARPRIAGLPRDAVLALTGITAQARALRPVTVPLGCAGVTTNGTAVRYGWTPPAALLEALAGAASSSTPLPHGSPIRS